MKSSVINISQRPRRMRGGAAPARRAAAAPRRGAVRRGGRRETKGVRPINHSTLPRGCGGGWGKETGAVLRYFCKDNVAEVRAGSRPTLSRRSAGTFVCNGGVWSVFLSLLLPPPQVSRAVGSGRGARRGSAEPGEWRARGAALAQPPAAEQWGTGGGKGLAWWYFFFPLFSSPPPLFFLSIPLLKSKSRTE